MSAPPIGLLPDPVNLVTASNLGVETSLQYSSDHYYFALSSDTSGANLFVGPIVVEGVGASLRIVDTAGNNALVVTSPATGDGAIYINTSSASGQTNSVNIRGGGGTTGTFNISAVGTVSPGNILNYNPAGSLVQLGNAGGIVQVLGATGVGQVYDEVNHPIISNTNITLIGSYNGAFGTITDVAYVAPQTGYFLVSYTLTCNGLGISWGTPAGSANLNVGLTLTQGSLVFIQGSEVSYYGIQQGPLQDTKQVLVYLTGGTTYYNDFQAVGTPNAGATGGLLVNIQPFA